MDIKEILGKVNGVIGKLPFVKLAEKIPEGARTKVPFLNALIPLANHIGSGLAVVVLVAALGGGGGGLSGSTWESQRGSLISFQKDTFSFQTITIGTYDDFSTRTGSYTVSDNKMILTYDDGRVFEWTILDTAIRAPDGAMFVRIR